MVKKQSLPYHDYSLLQSVLQGGLTSCQNCMKSLSERQVPLRLTSGSLPFPTSSMSSLENLQLPRVHCSNNLRAEGRLSLEYLHFGQDGYKDKVLSPQHVPLSTTLSLVSSVHCALSVWFPWGPDEVLLFFGLTDLPPLSSSSGICHLS